MSSAVTDDLSRAHLGRIARGGALGLAGALIAGTAGFVLVVVVARGLPATEAGLFFTVTAVFVIVEGLAVLGTDTGLARFLLRHEAAGASGAVLATVRTALLVTLALALGLALALAALAAPLAAAADWQRSGGTALAVVACALPAAVLTDLSLATARAFGEIRSTVVVDRLLRAGLQPVLVGVVLAAGYGLVAATAAWALTHLVAAVAGVAVLRRRLAQRGHGSLRHPGPAEAGVVGTFWSFTWPRGLARLAQLGMQKADIILLAVLISPIAAAAYTVATRFVPLGQMATQSIQQVLQPRMTKILLSDDRATLSAVYRTCTAWSMLLAWPLYLGVMALASSYLALFGDGAAGVDDAQTVVVVMAAAMMLAVASGPVDTLLLMAGRSRASAANAFIALGIDVVGCLLLVPPLGILGAALAWAAAVLTRCGLAFWQVQRDLRVHPLGAITARAALIPVLGIGVPAWVADAIGLPAPALVAFVMVLCLLYLAVLVWQRPHLGLRGVWRAPLHRASADDAPREAVA